MERIVRFTPLKLDGAYLIDLDKREDDRGFFARFFCADEYTKRSLDPNVVQINTSLSRTKGTLRGIHYQVAPKAETKIVRCLRGAIYDVIVDLRQDSATFRCWEGVTLDESNRTMMYVPKGFGHAIFTLEDDTEILYLVTDSYSPEHERTIHWNDPVLNISWPFPPTFVSEKDSKAPYLS